MQQRSASPIGFRPADPADAPIYRCYFIDTRGRVAAAEVVDQRDDAGAIQAARALLAARNAARWRYAGVELWDRDRRVHTATAAAAHEDGQAIA